MPTRWKFAVLYFSEGAPIGFLWWALPTLLRDTDVPVARIAGLTAALALPWSLKFLWAPLIDAWRGPRWGLRHWAGAAQLGMGAALVPLAWVSPATHFPVWFGLLLAHAFCAATQDVAIDALAVAQVEEANRGRLNAAMQIGMLTGRSLFGGGAILLVEWGGWPLLIAALLGAIWLSLLVLWRGLAEPCAADADSEIPRRFFVTLRQVFRRRSTWLGLGFALIAGAGFEAAGALAGPLLIDFGASPTTTGIFFTLPVVTAMAMGGWWGGRWSDQGSRVRRLAAILILLSASVGLLAWGAAAQATVPVLIGLLLGVYLTVGAFTTISYALFMDLTDRRLGGTQFSTFMAATNGCEVWAVATAGGLVDTHGYGAALGLMAAAGLLALGMLGALDKSRS